MIPATLSPNWNVLALFVALPLIPPRIYASQMVFQQQDSSPTSEPWTVEVSRDWDVLGPFPVHAREQHFLSPSFPLNLSSPLRVDPDVRWPSSYADGGAVGWSRARADEGGSLAVEFPDVRWASLRRTEGWAALQHHSVLRTRVTVYPPSSNAAQADHAPRPPRLRVALEQGSFFAFLPPSRSGSESESASELQAFTPTWHAGNIYATSRAPASSVDLPSPPSSSGPTTYDLVVSGDYEIRLFGDPLHSGRDVPVLQLHLAIEPESVPLLSHSRDGHHDGAAALALVQRVETHDVTCDFVDGYTFGDALGVGVRALEGWWSVEAVEVVDAQDQERSVAVVLAHPIRLAPTQTRIVPLRLTQSRRFSGTHIALSLTLVPVDPNTDPGTQNTNVESTGTGKGTVTLEARLPIKHVALAESANTAVKATYFYTPADPTAFLAVPPSDVRAYLEGGGRARGLALPVLALHGAGVDVIGMPFFAESLPRFERSWTIIPTGRTEWGLDWHGPSTADAWGTVGALARILRHGGHVERRALAFEEETRVVLVGHSNGGQGAWYISARYPDRVAAVVPAAGYIKAQQYVPLIHSRSAHYIDPALRAVLESSLTPDDDDLFLSNLAHLPLLAVHGGDDDNVPVWHSREAVSVVKTWRPEANASYQEDPGEPHWYPGVLNSPTVREFLDHVLDVSGGSETAMEKVLEDGKVFTLTVADPSASGSLEGFKVEVLRVPGRLARLHVAVHSDVVEVKTTNVAMFSVPQTALSRQLRVDDQLVHLEGLEGRQLFSRDAGKADWQLKSLDQAPSRPAPTRIQAILTSDQPLTIAIPAKVPSRHLSAALRLAHALDVYFKLSVTLIDYVELKEGIEGDALRGNVIALTGPGPAEACFLPSARQQGSGNVFRGENGALQLLGTAVDQPSQAAIFLAPPPTSGIDKWLTMYATDDAGLERALRLFPIRTGIAVPASLAIGEEADRMGAAGVFAAGVPGHDWSSNEAMTWTP